MKIVLLGPPGAGKGTQAEIICKNFSIPHISTGDMLREAIAKETALGKQAKEIMDAGNLVPDEVIINLVKERIKQEDCKNGYLFDGFPRTIPQADALDNQEIFLDVVLELTLEDELIINRMSGRRIHQSSGRSYHIEFNPPKNEGIDDETGETLIQRDDDKPDTVKNRLEVYWEQTNPLIVYYRSKSIQTDLKYIEIDGSKTMENVSLEIKKALEE
ncbi:MAG: adenylate kinase [Gammaproteobacteria bacterium]|jgi:adenylate kinase|nr:MAG: adenylate kinase [Gammaproteobacteria bacterium]|tara:strand:+ start:1088 stop:1735 length:648 start_codon:yes stop_codon:yes gene_type:complete